MPAPALIGLYLAANVANSALGTYVAFKERAKVKKRIEREYGFRMKTGTEDIERGRVEDVRSMASMAGQQGTSGSPLAARDVQQRGKLAVDQQKRLKEALGFERESALEGLPTSGEILTTGIGSALPGTALGLSLFGGGEDEKVDWNRKPGALRWLDNPANTGRAGGPGWR